MIFGMHVQYPATQPTITFQAQRLWDAGVSWGQIETARGVYDWTQFDAWLGQAKVPLLYTFGKTPTWAAASSRFPPSDLTVWDEFVTAVVTRAAGRIEAYELWNEPNLSTFYAGTMAQMVEMSRRAYNIIKTADKGHQALVVSPSPTYSSTYNVPVGKSGTEPYVWFKDYLDAGGGQYFDVAAFHGYPDRANPEGVMGKVDGMLATLAAHGLTKELWNTEASWGQFSDYPDQYLEAAMVAKLYLPLAPKVARFYWYGWEYTQTVTVNGVTTVVPGWGQLYDPTTKTARAAATAYQEVQKWMTTPVSSPAALVNGIWSVGLGAKLAVWATAQTIYKVPDGFTSVRDLTGYSCKVPSSRLLVVDASPVLFE